MHWMFMSPQSSYVQILTLNVMVLRGGAFEKWLGHESRALTNGIHILIKETLESSLAPSAMWAHSEKKSIDEPRRGLLPDMESDGTWPWTSRTLRNKFLLFLSHPV